MEQKLLHKYIAGDANPQEKETVIRWIEADKKKHGRIPVCPKII